MVIKSNKPLSMAEVMEYSKKDGETDVNKFIKKFTKLNPKEAKEFRGKLAKLGLMKLKEEHISKIIDMSPETQEDLAKIFVGVGLDEDESKKILDTVKEFK